MITLRVDVLYEVNGSGRGPRDGAADPDTGSSAFLALQSHDVGGSAVCITVEQAGCDRGDKGRDLI